jgi:hypothetical protein
MGGEDAGMDTVLSLHSTCPGIPGNQLACNDDWDEASNPTQCSESDQGKQHDSAVTLAMIEGQTVLIRVSKYPSAIIGNYQLDLSFRADENMVLDFNDFQIQSYARDQNKDSAVTIKDNGVTLHIVGNGWKKIDFPYTVTSNTILEFDFKSGAEGDIHGIGFDTYNGPNRTRTFKLFGTQNWGIPDFDDYMEPGWVHYRIPVGQFYTGDMLFLTFTNDHDVSVPDAESLFSNLHVFEGIALPKLDFNNFIIQPYARDQDQDPAVTIEDNGATLHIVGNGWKKIDFPYNVTPNTVLEFLFKSNAEGDVHGIGFDTYNGPNAEQTFKLFGTQNWGIPDFDNYMGPGWVHYKIPVGQFYTGEKLFLTFANDHDALNPDAESFFSFVKVVEETAETIIDFDYLQIQSYTRDQDRISTVTIEDNGATLHIVGNGWKKISFPQTVTPDTILEFDFKSRVEGDVHGIGFDTYNGPNRNRTFKLFGTQSWGIRDFDTYMPPGWVHFRIPVGQFYTGEMLFFTFTNDHDVPDPNAESFFSNIVVSKE